MTFSDLPLQFGISPIAIFILLVWALVWKGLAMWKAARLNQPVWFIALLIINTFGVLEILYIFVFSKLKFNRAIPSKKKKKR